MGVKYPDVYIYFSKHLDRSERVAGVEGIVPVLVSGQACTWDKGSVTSRGVFSRSARFQPSR